MRRQNLPREIILGRNDSRTGIFPAEFPGFMVFGLIPSGIIPCRVYPRPAGQVWTPTPPTTTPFRGPRGGAFAGAEHGAGAGAACRIGGRRGRRRGGASIGGWRPDPVAGREVGRPQEDAQAVGALRVAISPECDTTMQQAIKIAPGGLVKLPKVNYRGAPKIGGDI